MYCIYSIDRPGRLFEAGHLLNFHHFQQVKYVYFATKREEVTKQGFCKILWRKLRSRGSLLLEFIHSSGWDGGERLFKFGRGRRGLALIRG